MDSKNTYYEECALSYLPRHLAEGVRKSASLYRGSISEIRLRAGGALTVTANSKNILTQQICTCDDVRYTVRYLCGNSLYSHSETIKEGYICTDGGIRAGVCGRAVTQRGSIISVTDVSSIAIRVPHRVKGASDDICRIIMQRDFRSMIIYSPPGGGKTTALREIAARLGAPPYNIRIAVIDTRFEICGCLEKGLSVDALSGYPRGAGIETAVRTLSPQLIICDEIGSREDGVALKSGRGSGVPFVVSAHADSYTELCAKEHIRELLESRAFSHAVGLYRREGAFQIMVNRTDKKENEC